MICSFCQPARLVPGLIDLLCWQASNGSKKPSRNVTSIPSSPRKVTAKTVVAEKPVVGMGTTATDRRRGQQQQKRKHHREKKVLAARRGTSSGAVTSASSCASWSAAKDVANKTAKFLASCASWGCSDDAVNNAATEVLEHRAKASIMRSKYSTIKDGILPQDLTKLKVMKRSLLNSGCVLASSCDLHSFTGCGAAS